MVKVIKMTLTYRGFEATVSWNSFASKYYGYLDNYNDIISIQGSSLESVTSSFIHIVDKSINTHNSRHEQSMNVVDDGTTEIHV